MGIAILSGILSSLYEIQPQKSLFLQSTSGTSTPAEEIPSRLPSKFIACVRRPESAKKIKKALAAHLKAVKIVQNDNVAACQEADVVLLGCKPYMVKDILEVEGMKAALSGKLLISICAGVPVEQIEGVRGFEHLLIGGQGKTGLEEASAGLLVINEVAQQDGSVGALKVIGRLLDLALADDFETQVAVVMRNGDDDEVARLVAHPAAMIGASDAGAEPSTWS